jgi:hypothetical protein
MSKIDETLKKIAAGTTKANSPTSSSTKGSRRKRGTAVKAQPTPRQEFTDLPGDPDRRSAPASVILDNHPLDTRNWAPAGVYPPAVEGRQVHARLFAMSNLDELHLTFEFICGGHIGLPAYWQNSLELAFNQSWQYAGSLSGCAAAGVWKR